MWLTPCLTTQRIKILKWKKHPRDIILHKCIKNDNHIIYGSWDINCNQSIFFVILGHFLPFYHPHPLTAQKIKLSKEWKKQLEISSFYASVSKLMIIHYTVPEIWCMMDVIVIFHFRLTFVTFTPLTAQKIKIKKKEKTKKKSLEISSFYTSVPKIMIIWYSVLEIWRVMDVIVVFHFGQIFAFVPPPS